METDAVSGFIVRGSQCCQVLTARHKKSAPTLSGKRAFKCVGIGLLRDGSFHRWISAFDARVLLRIAEENTGGDAQNKQGACEVPSRFDQKIRGLLHAAHLARALESCRQATTLRILDQNHGSQEHANNQNDYHQKVSHDFRYSFKSADSEEPASNFFNWAAK